MVDCCYYIRVRIATLDVVSTLSCAKYQDQGHEACNDWRDEGIDKCNKWANQSYQQCSGWNKWYSWLCIAWTWVVQSVCVGWYWAASWVCHLWVWIANWVCIGWHWVPYLVVVGFLWMAYLVCTVVLSPCFWGSWLSCLRRKDTPRNEVEKPGWVLTFEDDFMTGPFDPTKWQNVPWPGEPYLHDWATAGTTPPFYLDPAGFSYGSGTVKLISNDQPVFGQTSPNWLDAQSQQKLPFDVPYRGAWLMWPNPGTLDQQYGYFEIRCKTTLSPEAWPSFWLISRKKEPNEIDIFEFNVKDMPGTFTTTVHWGPDKYHKQMQVKTHQVCRPWELFHIYACEWSSKEIRWYCDNQLIRVTTDEKILSELTYPLGVVLSTWPDTRPGHHPETGVYPNYFEVDYVRVYQRP